MHQNHKHVGIIDINDTSQENTVECGMKTVFLVIL